MQHEHLGSDQSRATARSLKTMAGFVIAAIIILALYVGQEIFIPLALSILLAFLLEPLVSRLKHWGLPQVPSIALVVLLALSVLGGAATYFGFQLSKLSQELPKYQDTIEHKLTSVQSYTSGPSVWDGAVSTLNTIQSSIASANASEENVDPNVQEVKVVAQEPSAMDQAMQWAGRIFGPLATAGIVFLFVVLILLSRKDLHDRLLCLLGGNLNVGTDALDEAATRIGTYLRMQLLVNVTYGIPMALGLWAIGVPAAIMWGLVAIVMRFIPYAGPMISAIFPITLAFAVDPGWNMVLWTVGLILALELISNNIVEPWLYGESTGLSTLSIIVAATFWTSLWGPVGLILSTPLTACLLVLSYYVPALGFLKILIGSEPVLTPQQRFYQRLVADDVDDAMEVAEDYIHEDLPKKLTPEVVVRHVNDFYDNVAIPAIRLFSNSHNTVASAEHRLRLQQGLKFFNHAFQQKYPTPLNDSEVKVMCIGARWEVDILSSAMLAHALRLRHVAAQSHAEALIQSQVDMIAEIPNDIKILCISIFHQQPLAQIRLLQHQIRQQRPDIELVFATWANDEDEMRLEAKNRFDVEVVSSVNELLLSVDVLLMEQGENPARQLINDNEAERLEALHDLHLLDPDNLPIYEQYIDEARQAFDVRYAQISLVDEDWVNTPASPLYAENEHPMEAKVARQQSICSHLVYQNEELLIEDIARDPRFARNKRLSEEKIRFYAGVPLRNKQGLVLGSLCILDKKVRSLSEDDVVLLKALADDLMTTLSSTREKQAKLEEIEALQQAQVVHETPQ